MAALAAVGCPVRVVGLVAAAENAVGGNALRPGDVVRHYGGRTTEVTNTDAEGRLVLADALAYAVDRARARPSLVDVATLTGAMKVALGQQVGGFFANDDALAARCSAPAARAAGEPLWRFPLADAYEDKLRSTVADADNAARRPGRDHRGAVPPALRRRRPLGPPRHRLGRRRARGQPTSGRTGPTGFGARRCWSGSARADPLAGDRPVNG